MPLETFPAKSEIVPVGAIEVRSALRMPCVAVEERKRAFFLCNLDGGRIGGSRECGEPAIDQFETLRRTVARAAEDQRVGKPGDAQSDAPFRHRFLPLLGKRKA